MIVWCCVCAIVPALPQPSDEVSKGVYNCPSLNAFGSDVSSVCMQPTRGHDPMGFRKPVPLHPPNYIIPNRSHLGSAQMFPHQWWAGEFLPTGLKTYRDCFVALAFPESLPQPHIPFFNYLRPSTGLCESGTKQFGLLAFTASLRSAFSSP